MKYIFPVVLFFANLNLALAEYEPYKFSCVYDASSDGMITLTSYIDPDIDKWTVTTQSSIYPKVDSAEAESAYVYSKDEEVDSETQNAMNALIKKLKIDSSKLFSTTDITMTQTEDEISMDVLMRIFKFNSKDGTLGIGIYTTYADQKYYTVCK